MSGSERYGCLRYRRGGGGLDVRSVLVVAPEVTPIPTRFQRGSMKTDLINHDQWSPEGTRTTAYVGWLTSRSEAVSVPFPQVRSEH